LTKCREQDAVDVKECLSGEFLAGSSKWSSMLYPPEVLRDLFEDALAEFWDMSVYEESVAREIAEHGEL
jgi:hypothetical protein